MKRTVFTTASVLSGATALFAGCAAEADEAAIDSPSADVDGIEPRAMITNVNADGTWTADALTPNGLKGRATFTGPAGKTRKMGVCSLRSYLNGTSLIPCNTVDDCSYLPVLETGWQYCTNINGTGPKYCFQRLGDASLYCAGTPANGGLAVAPGTYNAGNIGAAPAYTRAISYACFEGCKDSDPSVSSAAVIYNPH